MSRQPKSRVEWQCPVCERTFRIPATKPRPHACPECLTARESRSTSATASANAISGPLDELPSQTELPSGSPPSLQNRPPTHRKLNAKTDVPLQELDRPEIVEYLANISRTMTFFRRLVWGMAFVMILNVVVMGVGAVFAIQQLGSLQGLIQVPLPVNAQVQPNGQRPLPQAGEAIQQVGEYTKTGNDLLNELQSQ